MCKKFGYCRISTSKQNIERQERNIKAVCPEVIIYKEAYTGTKLDDRKEFGKLLVRVRSGDTIFFDSVSRMSRNAEDGFKLYEQLYSMGVELCFLKEPHINTATYKEAMKETIKLTGTMVDHILKGINEYLMALAKEQIRIAFEQAEKEVQDLHQRTREGIETARRAGKQIGAKPGAKLNVKKASVAKEVIRQHSKTFGGTLNDDECRKLAGVARNTYYKYKRELAEE